MDYIFFILYVSVLVQIVTQSGDIWQSKRFEVFSRQSRVEVNAQKDLQEMLEHLDAQKGETKETRTAKAKQKQRRKFIELAIPALVVTALCAVYCLIYLINYGHDIAHGQQMQEYIKQLHRLDAYANALYEEEQSRAEFHSGRIRLHALENTYRTSNIHFHNLLPSKTVVEWKILSRIEDHRKISPIQVCLIENLVKDNLFYSSFITDIWLLIRQTVLEFDEMHNWKTYYNFEKNFLNYCKLRLNIITLTFFNNYSGRNILNECISVPDAIFNFVIKFNVLLGNFEDTYLNKTREHHRMTAFIEAVENLTTLKTQTSAPMNNSFFSEYLHRLRNEGLVVGKELLKYFNQITAANDRVLNYGITCFICVFMSVCLTVLCLFGFGKLLKHESRLAVGVLHWLDSITLDLNIQKDSTGVVVDKIVPKVVSVVTEIQETLSMIPYHSQDATLFMCNISQFSRFFTMFSAAQTLHILTLIMELLDERMESYNVFPVTRMGNYQVVMSDTVQTCKYQHACEIANLALDIMTCCSDIEIGKQPMSKLQMKIGIHSGPNCGMLSLRHGVMHFNITGMSYVILKKIHKTAIPNRIQVSDTTYKLLSACETYRLHLRGHVQVKGLPQLEVFWLDGRKVSSDWTDGGSVCSRIGSWIEFEKKPLYRLDEEVGIYEPLNKTKARRYSQRSLGRCSIPNNSGATY